jgi:hypothetical protein
VILAQNTSFSWLVHPGFFLGSAEGSFLILFQTVQQELQTALR